MRVIPLRKQPLSSELFLRRWHISLNRDEMLNEDEVNLILELQRIRLYKEYNRFVNDFAFNKIVVQTYIYIHVFLFFFFNNHIHKQ